MKPRLVIFSIFILGAFLAKAQYNPMAIVEAETTIAKFKAKDAKFTTYFESAYGYVVFSSVKKGAIVLGGAIGKGVAFEKGNPVGKAKTSQATIGFQFGGQAYYQVIFFESKADFDRFKSNRFEFAAQASAVALDKGVATNLAYNNGVAVFTITKGGLMYEASIGGQKLQFKPFKNKQPSQI